jgi:hypothetical protein
MRMPLDTDQRYVRALLNGLAESAAPAERLYETVRRFAPHARAETKRVIARTLQKRSANGVPKDLIDLLEGYVRGEADGDETSWLREEEESRHDGRQDDFHNTPYNSYLNSVCGAAFGSLMHILDQRGTEQDRWREWELIDFVAGDPFRSLGEEHIFSLRGYIEAYAASRSIDSGLQELAEYMWKHGPIDPAWALSVIELILGNSHVEESEFHFAGGEELIRLVLRVYSEPLCGLR